MYCFHPLKALSLSLRPPFFSALSCKSLGLDDKMRSVRNAPGRDVWTADSSAGGFGSAAVIPRPTERELRSEKAAGAVLGQNISGTSLPFYPFPSSLLPPFSFPFPFPPQSLPLEVGVWGSAVSTSSGVWRGAPVEIELCAF